MNVAERSETIKGFLVRRDQYPRFLKYPLRNIIDKLYKTAIIMVKETVNHASETYAIPICG